MRARAYFRSSCVAGKREGCLFGLCILITASRLFSSPAIAGDPEAAPTVKRTRPQVDPPTVKRRISAMPTTEEILRSHLLEEPLVPVGGRPTPAENAELAAALMDYAKRSGPDDFSALTGFLDRHPNSPWRAALLTDLGLEYYNTAHYSLALDAWAKAWALAKDATDSRGVAIADRAVGELAYMYARLGRMSELEALLQSVKGRVFVGPATEKISGAREALWTMKHQPEIAFRCGPLALQSIEQDLAPSAPADPALLNSASTQKGFSLSQVAELSRKIGLDYQMAYREKGGAFVVPSVVHWKVGHYAAMVKRQGNRYLLKDPTFGNTVWATRRALEDETSGYFLIQPGPLLHGWRRVNKKEGDNVWGKGVTSSNDPKPHGPGDPATGKCVAGGGGGGFAGPVPVPYPSGLAVPRVHLMLVNLNLNDKPVGYTPPLGPPVRFTVRYNHREAFQPATFTYSNFGPKWTCDWISYITDNPQSPSADVNYYIRGGGTRTFTAFDTNTETYAFQQLDQTQLRRTGAARYEMVSRDGSKLVFGQSDGSIGTSRKIFLTEVVDPYGNAVSLTYDGDLRLTAITDAIGQVTTLTYGLTNDIYKITRVTDPFGRYASFDYDPLGRLTNITDVIGLSSQFSYETNGDFINALTTPYGTTTFTQGGTGTTRWLETLYPDGSRDRVEFNQSDKLGIPNSDPASTIPEGMTTQDNYLYGRNTFYWSRTACATAYGDYTKARIYHWLHTSNLSATAGILESTKEPLEGRVWYDYDGQINPHVVGSSNRPRHAGRVLDDGSTQLYTYAYNGFGNITNMIDPLGRTFSYLYASNGIDLLEVRMTRAGQDELLSRTTYNAQHLPLTRTDSAGQTTTYTYNARGQVLTVTDPKNETTTYTYDTNGYLIAVDGPLSGTNDTVRITYDSFGRVRTRTDVNGYTVTFDYDALDRITRITYPDSTFTEYTYNRLDQVALRDRAGREMRFEYNALRQMTRRTDPLGRVTYFEWCQCGSLKSLTDPMGRTTSWQTDVQGRLTSKMYGDGSRVTYDYENTTSRLRQFTDEKQQQELFTYYPDNTLLSVHYGNAIEPTPPVTYTYDPDYQRVASMTDGIGTTYYHYNPITTTPALGAGELASVDGPFPDDTITYNYDALGRRVSTAIDGIAATKTYDAAGRVIAETNALGAFTYTYDGSSYRLESETFPNGQTEERSYGSSAEDQVLQRITYRVGTTPLSEFLYGWDVPDDLITSWSQQAQAQSPLVYTLRYDAADQLVEAVVTNSGAFVDDDVYSYDADGNRVMEQAGGSTNIATYNALNQLNTITGPRASRTNEWDADDRLVAVNDGSQRTEFTYDGLGRLAGIRQLVNGTEISHRRFLWCDDQLCEERDVSGAVTKRFFEQGMKVETGPAAGVYYYSRDHLGSIRALTDGGGNVRALYSYDPYGRRTRVSGDVDADFGFAGMFWSTEAGLALTRFRAYDPELGRWLSRDPLPEAEVSEGPNLYAYVADNPVNSVDPLGLCCDAERNEYRRALEIAGSDLARKACSDAKKLAKLKCKLAHAKHGRRTANAICAKAKQEAQETCEAPWKDVDKARAALIDCEKREKCPPPPPVYCPIDGPIPGTGTY